jgi:hypothetical protein
MTDKFSAALRDGEIRGSRGVELMVDAGEMGMHQSSSLSVPLLRFCSRRVGGGIHGRALCSSFSVHVSILVAGLWFVGRWESRPGYEQRGIV